MIYPNPSQDKFRFLFEQIENSTLEIVNLFGQSMKKFTYKDLKDEIDISDLTNGIYFLQLRGGMI
ncbi:MAG: T9SS type A sorting domain-containing protein [Bacteroidota bacterium]